MSHSFYLIRSVFKGKENLYQMMVLKKKGKMKIRIIAGLQSDILQTISVMLDVAIDTAEFCR